MFKKNKKQIETIKEPKEKKVRTVKVGTHKKTVIALWVVLIASVSFGVYKNFTATDQLHGYRCDCMAYRAIGSGHFFCYLRSRSADKRGRTDKQCESNLYRKSPCGR